MRRENPMAALEFTVDLPSSRPGSAQRRMDDGWTYHHILPWRYYFLMGAMLVHMFRAMLASRPAYHTTLAPGSALAVAVANEMAGDLGRGVTAVYGRDAADFDDDAARRPIDLWKTIRRLDRQGGVLIDEVVRATRRLSPEAIALETLAPAFGGFAGMDGSRFRADDPGENYEQQKPHSLAEPRWYRISQIRQTCRSFNPGIADVTVRRLKGKLTSVDGWNVLLTAVQVLLDRHDRVAPFDPHDWDYLHTLTRVPARYYEPAELAAAGLRMAPAPAGRRFQLNSDGQGMRAARDPAGPAGERRLTRRPNSNEMHEAI
jgi:hypothetical protein